MKFSEMKYERPDLDKVLAQCEEYAKKMAAAQSGEELVQLYREENAMMAHYHTASCLHPSIIPRIPAMNIGAGNRNGLMQPARRSAMQHAMLRRRFFPTRTPKRWKKRSVPAFCLACATWC